MSGRVYTTARGFGERILGQLARRAEEHVKGMITPGTMFEVSLVGDQRKCTVPGRKALNGW